MKKSLYTFAVLLVLAGLSTGVWMNVSAEETQGEIIGTPKCKMCHKSEKSGNQMAVWAESAHAQAYTTLASEEALAIAKEKGIEDPQKAPECLSCHTTHAFLGADVKINAKGKYTDDEGVGCEACHGAGSEYKSNKVMKDPDLSKAAGLVRPDADSCLQCHNENSPTYQEFVYEERWAEIAHPVPTPAE